MIQLSLADLSPVMTRRAPLTLVGYASDWKLFRAWCAANGRSALPAATGDVAEYLVEEALNGGKKIVTAVRYVSAIVHYHRCAEVTAPDAKELRALLSEAQRIRKEKPKQKVPLTVDHVRRICQLPGTRMAEVRNRAILLLGFTSALRRSNLAALDLADIVFTAEGLLVHVRFEKQDQAAVGRYIGIPPGQHAETCPVRAVENWLALRGLQPGLLFQRVNWNRGVCMGRIHPNRIALIVKAQVASIGLNPADYAGHSLRSGFVTETIDAGVQETAIRKHTGHRSASAFARYYRPRSVFRSNPCVALGL